MLHCLTGCAIGEVPGTALRLPGAGTVVLSVAPAFVFGYALTMRGVLRAGLPVRQALGVALAADPVSIAVMEVIALAFVLPVPVDRWLMSHGRGHAVLQQHH